METKIVYVHWRDAMSDEASEPDYPAEAELIDLEEVGFLLDETDEAIQIGMEREVEGGFPSRWRLNIPKVNIVEIRPLSKGRKRRI